MCGALCDNDTYLDKQTKGCQLCSDEIPNCDECYMDFVTEEIYCQDCADDMNPTYDMMMCTTCEIDEY